MNPKIEDICKWNDKDTANQDLQKAPYSFKTHHWIRKVTIKLERWAKRLLSKRDEKKDHGARGHWSKVWEERLLNKRLSIEIVIPIEK